MKLRSRASFAQHVDEQQSLLSQADLSDWNFFLKVELSLIHTQAGKET